jgi:hypothetical protein
VQLSLDREWARRFVELNHRELLAGHSNDSAVHELARLGHVAGKPRVLVTTPHLTEPVASGLARQEYTELCTRLRLTPIFNVAMADAHPVTAIEWLLKAQ